jgi:hypothetical protein
MKVLILGTGKTGTTAMVYKVAGGLPDCRTFSGGHPGKHVGNYKNAVYKHTFEERKGKSIELFKEHLNKEHYDRKIWMARDPRDAAVSRMLYRWHRGYDGCKQQYEKHLELVLQKERDPRSVSFLEICQYSGYEGAPRTFEEVFEEENFRYQKMSEFVKGLGDDWILFTFEDMVAQKLEKLNQYLGFEIQGEANVPSASGKAKVIRKKESGDWRYWFTEKDVEFFKPAFLPYMELIGYDCNDWTLDPNPVIDPQFSSVYMQNLPQKATRNKVLRYIDSVVQKLKQGKGEQD